MTVGYLPHAFDLFNVEHLELISAARTRVDHLVVGLLTDEEVLARYGRGPVVPLVERLEIVRHVRGVDEVVVHDATAMPLGVTIFVTADDATRWSGAEVLPPVQVSASDVLRQALRTVVSAVA